MADDTELKRRFAMFERRSRSPGAYRALMRINAETDVREVLSSIRVPTLILHRSGDIAVRPERKRSTSRPTTEKLTGSSRLTTRALDDGGVKMPSVTDHPDDFDRE